METVQISKEEVSLTLYILQDLYSDFSLKINNQTAHFLQDAKSKTKEVGIFGLKVSHMNAEGFARGNISKFNGIKDLFHIRSRYIRSYTSLYAAIHNKEDKTFMQSVNSENDRLKLLVEELKSVLKYDFHVPLENL